MAVRSRILVLNNIAEVGLSRLPAGRYEVGQGLADPDAILLRSADLHSAEIAASVKAIGRAGAGTNNIPVEALTRRGVPVFNTPGANANAVKELVLAGLLLAARKLPGALRFSDALDPALDVDEQVERGKKGFAGTEIAGRRLGVIGLGRIGCLVADAGIKLGMDVIGHDPEITVDAAWSLPSAVGKAESVADVVRQADFLTVHVPLLPSTRAFIGAAELSDARPGLVLLNFSRGPVVDEAAVIEALEAGRLGAYVSDFPSAALHGRPGVIALPHLGASTREAEENCAVMVVDQVREHLEHGHVRNSVNFPGAAMRRESAFRLAIANANVPQMVARISTVLGDAGLNIHDMLNRSRGEIAYTLVDVDSPVEDSVVASLAAIAGVLTVRYLPLES